jgi:hypothetical protein
MSLWRLFALNKLSCTVVTKIWKLMFFCDMLSICWWVYNQNTIFFLSKYSISLRMKIFHDSIIWDDLKYHEMKCIFYMKWNIFLIYSLRFIVLIPLIFLFYFKNMHVPGLLFYVCASISVATLVSLIFLPETMDKNLADKINENNNLNNKIVPA